MKRRSKIITAQDAAAMVQNGMTIFIGGFVQSSHPMAIVREIIRRGIKDLTVVGAATSSMELDLLIAARSAKRVIAPYIGIEGFAPIAPFYRAYTESGELQTWEIDEAMYYTALQAGMNNLPSMPSRSGIGTDYMNRLNPDLKVYRDPISGQQLIAVPAINPDIAFLHADASDAYGNIRFVGSGFGDRAAARASDKIIVQVERIIANEDVRKTPQSTSIHNTDYVVRAPFGAHPFSSPGHYIQDDEMIGEFVGIGNEFRKSRDRKAIDGFLQKWIIEPKDHIDYLDKVGMRRLMSLNEY